MIEFDENGHALTTGLVQLYYFSLETGEYTGESEEQILEGFSIPQASTLIAAPEIKEHFVRIFNGGEWSFVEDNRGTDVYSTETQEKSTIDYLGETKEGFTLLAPNSSFDKWDGEKWIKDEAAEKDQLIAEAEAQKQQLSAEAAEAIAPLQDAVDLGIATDEEETLLKAWKKYRVFLNRINTSLAPDIDWPKKP